MQQIFRIGVLMSFLLIAVAGCGSMEWLRGSSGSKEAKAESEEARGESAPVSANGRSQIEAVHVLFAFDRADLNKAAQADLVSLIGKLQENPRLTVELEGYADSVGARDYNLRLSQKRVEAVRRYLVEKGVQPTRIRLGGLGQLPDGGTPDEQQKNRRVTLKLLIPKD